MIHLDLNQPDVGNWRRRDSQPIALATILLLLIVIGIGSIALWRATAESIPAADRAALARLLHSRTPQILDQLADRTRGLEGSQQEAVDQLQMVQDELQSVKRMLASEEADKRRLADQVAVLTEAVDGLRQSFASAAPDTSPPADMRPASPRPPVMNALRHRRKAKG